MYCSMDFTVPLFPQVTHLARLLASQMTSAGIGVGAHTKGIKPQKQVGHCYSPSNEETVSCKLRHDHWTYMLSG